MMKSTAYVTHTIAATLIVAGVAGLHAQSGSSSARSDESITVTGCLQPAAGDRTAVGTSGSADASAASGADANRSGGTSDSRSFMLVNARVGAAPGGGSGVTSVAPAGSGTTESAVRAGSTAPSPAIVGGTDGKGNSTAAGAMYALRGDNPELPRHVGQEVEISGRLIASAISTPSTAGASTSGAQNSTAGAADRAQQLEVRTIRMIASVCAAR